MPFSALLDACVLYPNALRDTLPRVAEAGFYQPLWSEKILNEVSGALVRTGAMGTEGANYLNDRIRYAFPNAMVSGWELLEAAMRNDHKDRHVLAAAIRGHADVIVTANLKDFTVNALEGFDVEAQHPDTFLCYELETASAEIIQILYEQAADTGKGDRPRWSIADVLAALEVCGMKVFVHQCRLLISQSKPDPADSP